MHPIYELNTPRLRHRLVSKVIARLLGYFWLPCPLCGQQFSGREWHSVNGLPSHIPKPGAGPQIYIGICPMCTRLGRGRDRTAEELAQAYQ